MTETPTRDRASAVLDIPDGLSKLERRAYVAGYAASCMRYARTHGIPSNLTVQFGEYGPPRRWKQPKQKLDPARRLSDTEGTLHERTVDYEWARHPAAHRAGLAALDKYRLAQAERIRQSQLVAHRFDQERAA